MIAIGPRSGIPAPGCTGGSPAGKTAIFFQVRDRIRQDRSNVVLDLKPDGYQLLKFKDFVLKLMSEARISTRSLLSGSIYFCSKSATRLSRKTESSTHARISSPTNGTDVPDTRVVRWVMLWSVPGLQSRPVRGITFNS